MAQLDVPNRIFQIRWDDNSISTFKGVGKSDSGKPRFTPAYALTIHKAQGKTIKINEIINPTRLFAENHLYVALTRATEFSSVFLTEPMSYKTFCKTVNVKNLEVFNKNSDYSCNDRMISDRNNSNRLTMLNRYIVEEPALTLEFLEGKKTAKK